MIIFLILLSLMSTVHKLWLVMIFFSALLIKFLYKNANFVKNLRKLLNFYISLFTDLLSVVFILLVYLLYVKQWLCPLATISTISNWMREWDSNNSYVMLHTKLIDQCRIMKNYFSINVVVCCPLLLTYIYGHIFIQIIWFQVSLQMFC